MRGRDWHGDGSDQWIAAHMSTGMLIAGTAFLLIAMHPFVGYPITLLLMRRQKRRDSALPETGSVGRSFAICMCAYNEERVIEEKMENLLRLKSRHPALKLFVYVDCSSDRTAEILSRYASDVVVIVSDVRRGKTFGMNLLVSKADVDIVVFTDANVILSVDVIDRFDAYFSDSAIGCVSGKLIYRKDRKSVG